ncbi:ubiquitin carboxyl-terminal hydrolase 7-like isoform X2 [Salarias fasciatus]|uniref:Probable ubiquitin carboxyl-terminal hydrolase creB n=1 Tax=Salarias fasciatus TaxID=181472 RepID=A0A672GH15_SALFA|nr:ubiquitin carboxyl-terminal hydrolase 7-like isoform X2 [Salarias fasciatus]
MDVWRRFSRRPPDKTYHGLQNQGATSYLNSVLQVLFMTKNFREALRRCREDDSFQTVLSFLFEQLENGEAHTEIITEGLGIRSGSVQGDAADCFEKIMNRIKSEEASQIFKIVLTHKNKCDGCGTESGKEEKFWHLPLELDGERYGSFKVIDGLRTFFRESWITGQDRLYCEKCKTKQDSTDKFEMKDHPEVLTLLLKRFQFDHRWNRYDKIQRSVEVPHSIPVQGQNYELYACVEHSGDLKRGHYTATIKSKDDGKWYKFSDTTVVPLSFQPLQVDSSHRFIDAYLLFYRREKRSSSGHEVSPPAASTLQTRGVSDLRGNYVKREEKEDEEETAGLGNVTESEGRSNSGDEERGEKILSKEKVVSEDKDRITTVDELRVGVRSPADVEGEEPNRKAADDRKPAGEHKRNKTIQTKYDLCSSPPGNTSSETSETRHEEQRKKESSQSKSFHQAVEDQTSAAVNYDPHSDCSATGQTSGQDYESEDQVRRTLEYRRGGDESYIHKPAEETGNRSEIENYPQRSYSNRPLNKCQERREIRTDDGLKQTRENPQRHSSQTAEGQDETQCGGHFKLRPQEDLSKETRPDVSVKRHNSEEELMRENKERKYRKRETKAEKKYDLKTAEESLSEHFYNLKLSDSSSLEKPERRDMGTQTEDMTVPSTLDTYSRNTGYFSWQSPH